MIDIFITCFCFVSCVFSNRPNCLSFSHFCIIGALCKLCLPYLYAMCNSVCHVTYESELKKLM